MQIEVISFLLPLCQNKSSCETIHNENEFHLHVHFHANQINFHLNGFAQRLVLKMRQRATWK